MQQIERWSISYQLSNYRHARTCMKRNKSICIFNFPIPPMPHTTILHPLENKDLLPEAHKDYQAICNCLDSVENKDGNFTFEDFLEKLKMNLETYILAVKWSFKQQNIFLKRKPNECRVNAYNCTLLKSSLVNINIQKITDPYACGANIVSCVSKWQRGTSNILYWACEVARLSDNDVRQQVRRIGNQFLTNVEIRAQEPAYPVLQMPLRRTSRSFQSVYWYKSSRRQSCYDKANAFFEEIKDDSTDIESNTVTL